MWKEWNGADINRREDVWKRWLEGWHDDEIWMAKGSRKKEENLEVREIDGQKK